MKVRINIALKRDIADPQGQTVLDALHKLGFDVNDVRVDKSLIIETFEPIERIQEMCDKLLVNPTMEEYSLEILNKQENQ